MAALTTATQTMATLTVAVRTRHSTLCCSTWAWPPPPPPGLPPRAPLPTALWTAALRTAAAPLPPPPRRSADWPAAAAAAAAAEAAARWRVAGQGAGDEAVRGGAGGDGVQGGHEHRQPLAALRGMGRVGLTCDRVFVITNKV
eukprot:scaffold14876_cov54-Phaeocystis_antarctica.AAC.1